MSFTDGTIPSRTCGTFYDQARQKVLTDSEWSFAILRRELAKSATPPDFGYSAEFKLPSDCLAVVEAFDKSTIGISPATTPNTTEWQVESGYIICDAEILKIRYIADVSDADLEVLVAGPTTYRRRITVKSSDFTPDPAGGAGARVANVTVPKK